MGNVCFNSSAAIAMNLSMKSATPHRVGKAQLLLLIDSTLANIFRLLWCACVLTFIVALQLDRED